MRKFVLSVVALFVCVGLTLAANVSIVKWNSDKKELTVKDENDKEKTYKVTDKTVVKMGDMDGDIEKVMKAWDKAGDKIAGRKLEIVKTDKDTLVEIKMQARKKKN